MTAVLAIRVSAGMVLAADSQTSMVGHGRRGPELTNTYHQARKILLLRQHPALAVLCWGAGSIGGVPFATLIEAQAEALPPGADATNLADLLVRGCNAQLADPQLADFNPSPSFGLLVVGYGTENLVPEAHLLRAENGRLAPSQRLEERLFWAGDGCEAIVRLVLGHGSEAGTALRHLETDEQQRRRLVSAIEDRCLTRLVHPEMPLAEAADLARFLLQACRDYARFAPGMTTVGGELHCLSFTRSTATWATPGQA
jgi:hypothetical protein